MLELFFYNFKTILYLLLGIALYNCFEQQCERYAKGRIETVNPILSFSMVIWGASGFFFLRFFSLLLPDYFNQLLQIVYTAIPDWDILFHTWTTWDWLNHPSWLFSSVMLPSIFLAISLLLPKFKKGLSNKTRRFLQDLLDFAIGLYFGISAHLIADTILFWIPGGDNYNFFVGLGELDVMIWIIWLLFNILLGLSIPFLIITKLKA